MISRSYPLLKTQLICLFCPTVLRSKQIHIEDDKYCYRFLKVD